MGYKDPDRQREYQRKWKDARRQEYIKPCSKCGSDKNIELHHKKREEKTCHKIWSWRRSRIEQELEKCEWVCRSCHLKEHDDLFGRRHGERHYRRGCRCQTCTAAAIKVGRLKPSAKNLQQAGMLVA